MSLVDPKSGVAYAFGEKLPSSHVNTVWAQQVRALDAVQGGSYTLGTAINWALNANVVTSGAGEYRLNHLRLVSGGSSNIEHAVDITSGTAVTWKGTTTWPAVDSRDVWRPVPLLKLGEVLGGGSSWVFAAGRWRQGSVSGTTEQIWFWVPPVDGAQLLAVKVWLTGAGGHPNLTNVTLPIIAAHKNDMTGSNVQIKAQADTSANATAYQTLHAVTCTLDSPEAAYDSSTGMQYQVVVTGEDGSAAIADMQIEGAAALWRVTDIRS